MSKRGTVDRLQKKYKLPKIIWFLSGYSLGFLAWLCGFHCLESDTQGGVRLSTRKLSKHLFKLFLWTIEIALVYQLLGLYRNWILRAQPSEIMMAFLVKSVIFLYIKVFWPRVFPEILPGLHVFHCPQCYQRQTFKFLPVSFKYGFFVTYLCGYCACLVNGWGEQVFFPLLTPFSKIYPVFLRCAGPIIFTLFIGFFAAERIFEYF